MKERLRNLRKRMTKKLKGTAAFEYVIVTPFTLAISVFSIMVLLFVIDFHGISSNLSQICNDLNMGDTGYKTAASMSPGPSYDIVNPNVYTFKKFNVDANATNGKEYQFDNISWSGTSTCPVTYTGNTSDVFDRAASYFIREADRQGLFAMPFMEMESLTCNVTTTDGNPFNTLKGYTESGSIINVTGTFRFCGMVPVTITSVGFID